MSSEQKKAKMDDAQYNDPHDLRMIWVDCEMTGLNVTVDHLIEIAVLITDKDLNLLATGPNLVIHQVFSGYTYAKYYYIAKRSRIATSWGRVGGKYLSNP